MPRATEGSATVGEFSWHELMTHDYPPAFRFSLFGWEKTSALTWGAARSIRCSEENGIVLGGMLNKTPEIPGPPGWLHYVRVNDVNRAIDAVTSRGGQVVSGPRKRQAATPIAQCMDPQGAMFAVHARRK